jgi:hypothetical protein
MATWAPQLIGPFDDVLPHMPHYDDIPEEFKYGNNKWCHIQSEWFFNGIKGAVFTPKPGIERQLAIRHLAMIQQSFDPSHEHKAAAVAYLMSLWFEDVQLPS